MSGYLEVKHPFKSSLVLNPFKTWKKQWCILRPSLLQAGTGALVVYSSESGTVAGTVDLASGCLVRRTKSRTRPYAFAVFAPDELRKPRILLAAATLHDTQVWIEKIRALLNGNFLGNNIVLKDSFSVNIVRTDLSRSLGLIEAEAILGVTSKGLTLTQSQRTETVIPWRLITDVILKDCDKTRLCIIPVNSGTSSVDELKLSCSTPEELAAALKQAVNDAAPRTSYYEQRRPTAVKIHRRRHSEGDIYGAAIRRTLDESQRPFWYSGPSEVSLDDTDLVMSKESRLIPSGRLSRCTGAGDLDPDASSIRDLLSPRECHSADSIDDGLSDRRSLMSLASGIYEEIPEDESLPVPTVAMTASLPPQKSPQTLTPRRHLDEPTYESVADCVFATMRRVPKRHAPPPPLPPRHPYATSKVGESWSPSIDKSVDKNVTRHSSLGSIPCSCIGGAAASRSGTLPKSKQAFNVFRKRLKSDSRIASATSHSPRETKADVEPKKNRFDFTPSRDIFKSFKVSRSLMKNLKITSGNLSKIGETKSCEFLDDTQHVAASSRCAKSVECLDVPTETLDTYDAVSRLTDEPDGADLSVEFPEKDVLSMPTDIVELILRGKVHQAENLLRQRRLAENHYVLMSPETSTLSEGHYLPMSPVIPPSMDQHCVVVASSSNVA